MRYTDAYLLNHDIDWFFIINGVYVHAATAGGRLPDQINDDERLRVLQYQVEQMPDIYTDDEIEYNDVAINNVVGINGVKGRQQYIESFTAMARKGFASFDRTNILNPDDNQYHLVCKPRNMGKKPQGLDLINLNDNNMEVLTEQGLIGFAEYIQKDIANGRMLEGV